jgi:diamine N-acetyltransferase
MSRAPASVQLREITAENEAELVALAVAPGQQRFVAGVARSLAEAAETPGACPWYRGVYDGDTPVGFVMISDNIPPDRTEYLGPYFLWRLLIDSRFQRRGYGRATLDLIVDYVRSRPGADVLFTSFVPGEGSPVDFYLRYGFSLTGEVFDDEPVLALPLHN